MKDLKGFISKLTEIEQYWNNLSSVPEDLFNQIKGLTKTDVSTAISGLRIQLETASDSNQSINPLYLYHISSQINNLDSYVKQHIPSNPSPHVPGFVSTLYGLASAIDLSIVNIDEEEESFTSKVSKSLRSRMSEVIAKAETVNGLLKSTHELIEKNKKLSVDLISNSQSSQETTAIIQDRDRITNEATNRINEVEKKSSALYVELEGNLKKVNEINTQISSQQDELNKLSKTLQGKLEDAQKLLEDANRHGLAGAFKTRKDELALPGTVWTIVFLLSIVVLCLLAKDTLDKSNSDWHFLLFRLPFSAPLIWLAWFSVKQYGYTRRLQEDYAFKVASAMSFQGYKNEVHSDEEILKLLRKSVIENFSSNPLRIYDDNKNHGSPLQEMIENVSEDRMKRIIELFKLIKP